MKLLAVPLTRVQSERENSQNIISSQYVADIHAKSQGRR